MKTGIKISLFGALLLFCIVSFASMPASATAWCARGFFGGARGCTNDPPSVVDNDVLSGRSWCGAPCGQVLPNSTFTGTQASRKASFISFVEGRLRDGQLRDEIGAAFIISSMAPPQCGGNMRYPSAAFISCWEAAINNPAIAITDTTYSFNNTSFFSTQINDDIYTSYQSDNRHILRFTTVNGMNYAIEINCGNPIGGLQGLPNRPTPPPWNTHGVSYVRNETTGQGPAGGVGSTTVQGKVGDTITFRHAVINDGPGTTDDFGYTLFWEPSNARIFPTNWDSGTLAPGAATATRFYTYVITAADAGKSICQSVGWSPTNSHGGINGRSTAACVQVANASPSGWSLGGASTVVATASPGQTVTFYHNVTNYGPATSGAFAWNVYTSDSNGNNKSRSPLKSGNAASLTKDNWVSAFPGIAVPYLIPNNAVIGSQICEVITYQPASSASAAGGQSPAACVTIVSSGPGWRLKGTSTVVATAAPGTTVTFHHNIINNGTVTSSSFLWGIYNSDSSANNKQAAAINAPCSDSLTATTTLGAGNSIAGVNGIMACVTIPINALPGQQFCQVITFQPAINGSPRGDQSSPACVTVVAAPPPPADCIGHSSAALSIPYLEPGASATLTLSFPSTSSINITSVPSGFIGLSTGPKTPSPGGNTWSTNITAPSGSGTANVYTITWTANGVANTCTGTISVVNLPYFSVYGSSVNVGNLLAGWYNNSGGSHYGSSTQLAAIALSNTIYGFGSSQYTSPPTNLSFANSANTSPPDPFSPPLGGNFSIGGSLPSYDLSSLPTSGTPLPTGPASSDNIPGGTSRDYLVSGGQVNINDFTVSAGVHITIHVKGNIVLTGNNNKGIVYDTTTIPWSVGPTSSNIPSVTVVAEGGNIYVDDSIPELDGIYVATKAGGNGGQIFTCVHSSTGGPNYTPDPYTSDSNLRYGRCNQSLTVYGAFIADQINLGRTFGTILDKDGSMSGKCSAATGVSLNPYTVAGGYTTCAAETFDFSPEMYLSGYRQSGGGQLKYDSITSLPPVL